jgi:hypothetical protein
MAVFHTGNVSAQQSRAFFDVALGEFLFFPQLAQAITDKHGEIVPLRRAEGKEGGAGGTLTLESFFLTFGESANTVTIEKVLIEQFENLGRGERVVVKLKEHDTLGSLVGEADSDSRTAQGTCGTDYVAWSFAEVLHRNSIESHLGSRGIVAIWGSSFTLVHYGHLFHLR